MIDMKSRQAWTRAFLIYFWIAVTTALIYYALGIEGAAIWISATGGVAIEYTFDILNSIEDKFDSAQIPRHVTVRMKAIWGVLTLILSIALIYCLFNVSEMGALALIILPSLIIALIYYVLKFINGLIPPDESVNRDYDVNKVRPEHAEHMDPSEIPPCIKRR